MAKAPTNGPLTVPIAHHPTGDLGFLSHERPGPDARFDTAPGWRSTATLPRERMVVRVTVTGYGS